MTFVSLGDQARQEQLVRTEPALFLPKLSKARFYVDHYPVGVDGPLDAGRAHQIGYWHSMWSHRRDHRWKGFVEVSLGDAAEDDLARYWLVAQDLPAGEDGEHA